MFVLEVKKQQNKTMGSFSSYRDQRAELIRTVDALSVCDGA